LFSRLWNQKFGMSPIRPQDNAADLKISFASLKQRAFWFPSRILKSWTQYHIFESNFGEVKAYTARVAMRADSWNELQILCSAKWTTPVRILLWSFINVPVQNTRRRSAVAGHGIILYAQYFPVFSLNINFCLPFSHRSYPSTLRRYRIRGLPAVPSPGSRRPLQNLNGGGRFRPDKPSTLTGGDVRIGNDIWILIQVPISTHSSEFVIVFSCPNPSGTVLNGDRNCQQKIAWQHLCMRRCYPCF
jgi:hypothetical protein